MKEHLIQQFDVDAHLHETTPTNCMNEALNKLENYEKQHPYSLGIIYSFCTSFFSVFSAFILKVSIEYGVAYAGVLLVRCIIPIILFTLLNKPMNLKIEHLAMFKDINHFALVILWCGLSFGWIFGLKYLIISDAQVFFCTTPICSICWSVYFNKKLPSISEIIIVIVAMIGVILVVQPSMIFQHNNSPALNLFGVTSAIICAASGSLSSFIFKIIGNKTSKINLLLLLTYSLLIFTIVLVILSPFNVLVELSSTEFWVSALAFTFFAITYNYFNMHASILIPIPRHFVIQYTTILGAVLIDIIKQDFVYNLFKILGMIIIVLTSISAIILKRS